MNNRIKQVRSEAKLSQTEFGNRVNLSQNYIWMIEKGERTPSDRTIADICREFNVSEVWLREGIGDMYVTRTMNQELAIMVNELMSDADDSFRKRFVSALLDLPPQLWPELEKFIKKISQGE